MEWYIGVLKNYADFSGRARRKEYWMFVLVNLIIGVVLGIISAIIKTNILSGLYSLAVLVPSIAVCVRRLHDIGKSGLWFLISFVPIIGGIWLLILLCMEGESGTNQFGTNPKLAA